MSSPARVPLNEAQVAEYSLRLDEFARIID